MECMSSGWHILQYVVFCWKTCLTGEHIFLEGMYYRGPCFAVQDILCSTGGMSYRKSYIT